MRVQLVHDVAGCVGTYWLLSQVSRIGVIMPHWLTMTKLLLISLASALAAQTNYDLLLQGGRVIDPKNAIDARMDVAIANGRIARVAAAIPASEARRVINVSGLLVTPGLIDIHVHVYQRPENRSLDHDSSVHSSCRSRLAQRLRLRRVLWQ